MPSPNASSLPEQEGSDYIDAPFLAEIHRAISLLDQVKSLGEINEKQWEDEANLQEAFGLLASQNYCMGCTIAHTVPPNILNNTNITIKPPHERQKVNINEKQ